MLYVMRGLLEAANGDDAEALRAFRSADRLRELLVEPHVLNSLPENFELVILPDDDPDIRLYNLELLDQYGSEGRPVVFARLQTSRAENLTDVRPQFYIPLAA